MPVYSREELLPVIDDWIKLHNQSMLSECFSKDQGLHNSDSIACTA